MNFRDLDDLDDDETQTEESSDADDEYSEAEHRLAVAAYYRQLTRGGLFNDDSDEARQVDEEVRQFARERMDILIGIRAESPKSTELPFTDEQLSTLRQWANHLIERAAKPTVPVVRPMTPPPVAKPPIPVPAAVQPLAPPKAGRKPLVKKETRPLASKPARKASGKTEVKAEPLVPDYEALKKSGEPFVENGKKYKFVYVERPGGGKHVKMDVTEQVANPRAIPTPTPQQAEYLSAMHAGKTIDALPRVAQVAAARSLVE